jgi:hypothetical protein
LLVQRWVLKRVVTGGGLGLMKGRELLDSYLSSTPDKQAAVDDLLIPCATFTSSNRSECARQAMATTLNKAATATAIAPAFYRFDSTTRKIIAKELDAASWRKLALTLVNDERESLFSFLTAQDFADLMASDEPAQLDARMSFLIDSMVGSSDKKDAEEGHFKLSSVVRLAEAIRLKELQPGPSARRRLAGKLARDLHTCEDAVCGEAVLMLMPWFQELEAKERTAFERQLIKLAGDEGLPGIIKLSTLCVRGWSPEGDVTAVREKVGALLAAEKEGSPAQLTLLVAWACFAESARREESAAMAKSAVRQLGLAPPDHLGPVLYAFGKLKPALEKEDRTKAWAEIVRRLTEFEIVQSLESERPDALTIDDALSQEGQEAEEKILQTVTAAVQEIMTSDPDPAHTVKWVRWFRQITKNKLRGDSPRWSELSRAALARLERSWVKSWGVLLPEALPAEVTEKNKEELARFVVLSMKQTRTCSDVTNGLAALAKLNPSGDCASCGAAIEATLDQVGGSGACNGYSLGQLVGNKRVQWAAQRVAAAEVGPIARRIALTLCKAQYTRLTDRSWQEILSYLCVDNAKVTCSREADDIKKAGCASSSLVDEVITRP